MEDVTTSPPQIRRQQSLATYAILIVNLVIYASLEFHGGPTYENLIRYGAKENGLIAVGQWYRLFTPMFLHAGLMHLGFNMYALYQVGRILEYMIGPKNYLAIYFIGGLTASLCSFALSPALSVGASGSLYALLLALFVIQRYEIKLAKEIGLDAPKSPLGTFIIINGLITFVIPNIDWAAHLGGAIAGTLLGYAFTMKHRWKMRLERCRKFLDPYSAMPKRNLHERSGLYTALLIAINIGFSAKFFYVSNLDKAFGLGMLEASQIKDVPREKQQIAQFGKLFTSERSEANPVHLARVALSIHKQGLFLPAFLTYHSALLIAEETKDKITLTDRVTIQALALNAYENQSPHQALSLSLKGNDESSPPFDATEECVKAADLLSSLRFFEISAKLYESAFLLKPDVLRFAVLTFTSLKKQDEMNELFRFRNLAEVLESKKNAGVAEFKPSDFWTWSSPRNGNPAPQNDQQSKPEDSPGHDGTRENNSLPPI